MGLIVIESWKPVRMYYSKNIKKFKCGELFFLLNLSLFTPIYSQQLILKIYLEKDNFLVKKLIPIICELRNDGLYHLYFMHFNPELNICRLSIIFKDSLRRNMSNFGFSKIESFDAEYLWLESKESIAVLSDVNYYYNLPTGIYSIQAVFDYYYYYDKLTEKNKKIFYSEPKEFF